MLGPVAVTAATCFCTIGLGCAIALTGLLGDAARKGLATLYVKLVFPTMVFRGVAAIKLASVDPSMVVLVLSSKLLVAGVCIAFGRLVLSCKYGRAGLAHSAMLAMAASHSFDVTWGVPLAKLLYPLEIPYIYLNQSVQLVLVNPLLLVLIELGSNADSSSSSLGLKLRSVFMSGVAKNPLVVMTVAGLLAGQLFPMGLPPVVEALSKQVADAGPLLGFLALGFAVSALGGTGQADAFLCLVLAAMKMLLMPALYTTLARLLSCSAPPAFLSFLGALPASASVYSLSMVKGLSPKVIGPLVPFTMVVSLVVALAPLLFSSEPGSKVGYGEMVIGIVRSVLAAGAAVCALYLLIHSGPVSKAKSS